MSSELLIKCVNKLCKMNKSSSDSGSDEEESRKLREAVIDVKEVLQTKTKTGESKKMNGTKPSLRPKEKFDNEDMNELHTTPEFRTYVGKKLLDMIDQDLLIDNIWQRSSEEQQNSEESCFRLFQESDPKSSYEYDPQTVKVKQKRPIASSSSSDDSEEERLASVAVSSAAVLSTSAIHTEMTYGSTAQGTAGNIYCTCNKSSDVNSEAQRCENCCTNNPDSFGLDKKKKRKNKKKRQKDRGKDRDSDCEINRDKLNKSHDDTSKITKKKLKHKHKN